MATRTSSRPEAGRITVATNSTETALADLLREENMLAARQPWARLDRGLRVQRLRAFAAAHPSMTTATEVAALARVLVQALDARTLNSKQRLQYDSCLGVVQDVSGLCITRLSCGGVVAHVDASAPPFAAPPKRR